jgi:hypothetical protein
MRVEKPVRKADEVGRKPVAADVRRLPDALISGPVSRRFFRRMSAQRFIERVPKLGAALVALAVRADEKQRRVPPVFSRRRFARRQHQQCIRVEL